MERENKLVFLRLQKNVQVKVKCFTQYLSYLNPKEEESSFKIKIGVAGLIFDPHPLNFENQYNFLRCSNDAKMIL